MATSLAADNQISIDMAGRIQEVSASLPAANGNSQDTAVLLKKKGKRTRKATHDFFLSLFFSPIK